MSQCEQKDCSLPGSEYTLPDGMVMVLCADHAAGWGFCPGCGWLAAGADDDFIARHGVCYECFTEMQAELGEYDDDNDWNDRPFEY